MYIHFSWLFVVLTISWLTCVSHSHTNSSNNLLLDQLTKSCPTDGIPVCGVRDKQFVLFSNECLLKAAANKDKLQSSKIYKKLPLKYCLAGGCQLSCPKRHKPVCARNMKTYQTQMFWNQCELVKNICKTNKDWRIVNYGMCPEDYLKTRRHKDNPNKRHLIVKRSYHNNLYNPVEYNANSFVRNKNELDVAPNDVFVYMQPELRTQFLSHDTSSYQHPMPEHKSYDEILNKIAKLSPADMPFSVEEDKKVIENSLLEQSSTISPLAFAVNRLNLNYLSNHNFAFDMDRQSFSSAREAFTDTDKNEYYYDLAKIGPSIETEDFGEMPITAVYSSTEATPGLETSTVNIDSLNGQEVGEKSIECKFGTGKICAALADGTVRTFETICEMMTANVYFKNTWTKLHEGSCEDCKHNCSRDYQPVCVSRNGVNYTMVNECYYNMGICMDKKSKWQKLSNNECERYTRITDRYVNSKPGFRYTSNYFVSTTTAVPSTTAAANNTEKVKINKIKKHGPNFKRAIKGVLSSQSCCPESHYSNETGDNITCECADETTPVPSTTESHIMSLLNESDEEE